MNEFYFNGISLVKATRGNGVSRGRVTTTALRERELFLLRPRDGEVAACLGLSVSLS